MDPGGIVLDDGAAVRLDAGVVAPQGSGGAALSGGPRPADQREGGLGNTGQAAPQDKGAIIRCALESLAFRYRWVLECLEDLTGRKRSTINIVGEARPRSPS